MKINLKIEGTRMTPGQHYGSTQKTEPYVVAEIVGSELSNAALGGILRALADDINPIIGATPCTARWIEAS